MIITSWLRSSGFELILRDSIFAEPCWGYGRGMSPVGLIGYCLDRDWRSWEGGEGKSSKIAER